MKYYILIKNDTMIGFTKDKAVKDKHILSSPNHSSVVANEQVAQLLKIIGE